MHAMVYRDERAGLERRLVELRAEQAAVEARLGCQAAPAPEAAAQSPRPVTAMK